MCWYHVTFHIDLEFEHTLDVNSSQDHDCKFGGDPAICLRETICAKSLHTDGQTDRQTDERRTPRHCISSLE